MPNFGMFEFLKKKRKVQEVEETEKDATTAKASVTRLHNQIRKLKYDIKVEQLQRLRDELEERKLQQEIDDYKDMLSDENDTEEEEGESMEDLLLTTLLGKFINPSNAVQPVVQPPSSTSPSQTINPLYEPQVKLDDRVLTEHIATIPKKHIKLLNQQPIEKRREIIKTQFPDIDNDTVERAIKIIEART